MPGPPRTPEESRARAEGISVHLATGDIALVGRIRPASNLAFLGEVTLDDVAVRCIYKPVRGERPLWDFPTGTLAGREYAAWAVSDTLGWGVVPPTTLREGPGGPGMVQEWQDVAEGDGPIDIVPAGQVPTGWHAVVDGLDADENDVSLVHDDSQGLRRMAIFDALVNNADRKGGHVLRTADGRLCGIDHGVTFHVENKLRTVLWGWAGEPLTDDEVTGVTAVLRAVSSTDSALRRVVDEHLDPTEVVALAGRCQRMLRQRRFPEPDDRWPVIPWPPF